MVYGIPNLSPSVPEENAGCQEKKSAKKGKRKGWIFLLLGREDFTNILRVGEEERRWGRWWEQNFSLLDLPRIIRRQHRKGDPRDRPRDERLNRPDGFCKKMLLEACAGGI
jgi:hypothetical protein